MPPGGWIALYCLGTFCLGYLTCYVDDRQHDRKACKVCPHNNEAHEYECRHCELICSDDKCRGRFNDTNDLYYEDA